MKMKTPFWSAPPKNGKCYNIKCHFKPHSLNVFQKLFSHITFLWIWNTKLFYQQAGSLKLFLNYIVTRYSLSIEQRFLDNQFVSGKNDPDFTWYNKCGEENTGLKFIFHLKDDKGHIFSPSLTPLELNAEIFYVDVSATPFMPQSPLKEKKSSQASKNLSTIWLEVILLFVCVLIYYEW